MLRHLTSKIKATGPITVAEYMREVLTNPVTVSHDRTRSYVKRWLVSFLIFLSLMRLATGGRQRRPPSLGSVHGAPRFRVILQGYLPAR